MLRKLISVDETASLVLLCDPAVWEAQLVAARALVEEELDVPGDADLMDSIISAVRATSGKSDITQSLMVMRVAGAELLDKVLDGEEKIQAMQRLSEALGEEDVRLCLAWVRAQAATAQYRESSDPADLLDANPKDATRVTIRPPTKEALRRFERGFRAKPRLGEMHHSRAGDHARKATRRGGDANTAFGDYIAGLDEKAQKAVEDYENWVFDRDCELFSMAVESIEGFEALEKINGRYPVVAFGNACIEAEMTITEVARHIRNLCQLGKSRSSRQHFLAGNLGHESKPSPRPTDGPARSASTTARAEKKTA